MPKRAVFIDRDGTLIEEKDYLGDPAQVKLIAGAVTGLKRLKSAGFLCVVVSNQAGVGRGLLTRAAVEAVQSRFIELLAHRGVRLDGYYWCPHKPSDRCACRKPKLGLVKRAARQLKIEWRRSFSVGDRPSDVQVGQRTGGWGVLVRTGYGRRWKKPEPRPDHIASDFKAAVEWIIKRKGRVSS